MTELVLKLLNWIGGGVAGIWAARFDVQVLRTIRSILAESESGRVEFEDLLQQIGAFDENPNELRRVLASLGARRYRSSTHTEEWGYPAKNPDKTPLEPWPFFRVGVYVSLCAFSAVVVTWIIRPETAEGVIMLFSLSFALILLTMNVILAVLDKLVVVFSKL